MSQWYYSDAMNRRQGPVDADTLAGLHRDGRIGPDTLVWRDGMDNWQRWRSVWTEVLPEPAREQAPAAVAMAAGATATPATLADGANPYEVVEPSAPPTSPYAPPASHLTEHDDFQSGGEVVYAGFWKRFAALAIDNFLIGIVYYMIVIVATIALGVGLGAMGGGDPSSIGGFFGLMAVIYLAYPLLSALYYVGFESSSKQATLGKMAIGIKVTDDGGRRLSRGRALGRWASHMLCYFTIYIGYVMAAFTDRKRGLHDMVAGTLVVDRWAYTASPQLQRRELGAVTIVIISLAALMVVGYAVVLLAIALPAYQDFTQRAAGV
ncbi:DUF4339 domain-containing protein [Lysobacter maris]|uniref:DUF4339 domain-containing protein n=1 Tax=Marilutibacter maris TaxID=1605891 RepID=A0A508AQR2_9GAMM|nr:RDD family protein [Lysobacter maris]KAB8190469.1 DUF4339 domain-containing protein [Lysobacter maris]